MKIYENIDVIELLNDSNFNEAWEELMSNCPWSTVFQSPAFIRTWHNNYRDQSNLIVISDYTVDGTLKGLLFLTKTSENIYSHPGLSQAEYQSWISTPANNDAFISNSLKLFEKTFPNASINLKYVPSQTPLNFIKDDGYFQKRIFSKTYQQPILESNEEKIAQELRKKNKKEKINRLKRKGSLVFEKIESHEEFKSIIDDLIIQNDFRKGAMYGKLTFMNDPLRKHFLMDCFKLGILHVTILKLNEEIIASNVGFKGSNVVHLQGINTHSPNYAKFSPGILHFLMLGKSLCEENIGIFDLTPGGVDGYKSMLASKFLITHEIVFCSRWEKKKLQLKEYATNHIKQLLKRNNISDQKRNALLKGFVLKKKNEKIRIKPNQKTLDEITIDLIDQDANPVPKDSFKLNIAELPLEIPCKPIRKNRLEDFLTVTNLFDKHVSQKFLLDAMKRFELNHDSYTLIENGELKAILWFIPKNSKTGEKHQGKDIIIGSNTLAFSYLSHETKLSIIDFISCIANEIIQDSQIDLLELQIKSNDVFLKKLWKELQSYESHFFNY